MKKVLFTLLILLIFACNEETKKNEIKKLESQTLKEKEVENPNFTVKLVAKVLYDDQFRLLYTQDLNTNFDGKQAVFINVKGTEGFQTIEFKIPNADIYPVRLRLNVGYNKDQKGIDIESLEILHHGNQFIISDTIFNKYFYPNKYIQFNKDNGEIKFQKDDGKHIPFFVSRTPLHEILYEF